MAIYTNRETLVLEFASGSDLAGEVTNALCMCAERGASIEDMDGFRFEHAMMDQVTGIVSLTFVRE